MNEKSGINIEEYKLFLQHMNNACDHLEFARLAVDKVPGAGARAVSEQIWGSQQTMTGLTNDCAVKVPEKILSQDAQNADNIKKGLVYWGERVLPGAVSSVIGTDLGLVLVGLETYARAGMGKYAYGNAMEIMVRNQHNLNPFRSANASLGTNMIETGGDLIEGALKVEVKAGGEWYAKHNVLPRIQRGDYAHCDSVTVSKEMYASLADDLDNGVINLSDDAAKATGKSFTKIKNSHISNNVAKKAAAKGQSYGQSGLSGEARRAQVDPMMKKFKLGAKAKAGIAGGIIGGGLEAVFGYQDLKNGTITGGQYANNIAREAVAGAVSGVVSTAAVAALAAAGACGAVTFGAGLVIGAAVSVGVSWLWNDLAETVVPNVTQGAKEVAKSVSEAYETGKVDMKAIGESYVKDVGNAVKSGAESVKTGIEKMTSPTSFGDFVEGAAKVVAAPVETALNVAVSATKAVVNTVASAGAAVVNWIKKW